MKALHSPGESRTCPHCKAMILKSAAVCPLCRHNLRFVSLGAAPRLKPSACPLSVEGILTHPGDGEALEYSVVVEVRSESGRLLSRQIVGVGAIDQTERRVFLLRVEVSPAGFSH